MTVEAKVFSAVIRVTLALNFLDLLATYSSPDTVDSFVAFVLGLWIESHALKTFPTMEADEAFGVESLSSSTDDTTCDGQLALCAGSGRSAS
jgi:hypothetical protein